jgi:hypothetical protein
MKNSIKLSLLAVAAAAVTSAQGAAYSSGDLLIGFNSGSGGTDYLLDAGPVTALVQGETWNVNTLLGFPLNTAGSPNRFGAFAYDEVNNLLWMTAGSIGSPLGSTITGAKGPIEVLASGQTGNNTAIQAGQTRVTTVASDSTFQANFYNQAINNTLSGNLVQSVAPAVPTFVVPASASTTLKFWEQDINSVVTQDSFFKYDQTSGILTFGTAAVPEPGTYGILAGLGVLALSLRRQFARV